MPSKGRRYDVLSVAAPGAGNVIAATPTTTQARPSYAVGDKRSPSKITLIATPIGTRR
jgi:hypothetical protein